MKVIKGKYELFPLDVFLKKQKTKNNNKESMQKKKKAPLYFFRLSTP